MLIADAVPDRDSVGDVLDLTADVPAGGTTSRLILAPRPPEDMFAAGMTDYVAIIVHFATAGTIGEMDAVYSTWATRAPDGFNDAQIAALQGIAPYLALAIKSVSLVRMTSS
jgi:hypothetical protein